MNLETLVSVMVWLRATSIGKLRLEWSGWIFSFIFPYSLGMSRCTLLLFCAVCFLCCHLFLAIYVLLHTPKEATTWISLQNHMFTVSVLFQILVFLQHLFREKKCIKFVIITNLPIQGNLEQKLSKFFNIRNEYKSDTIHNFTRCRWKCIKQPRTNSALRIQFWDNDGSV